MANPFESSTFSLSHQIIGEVANARRANQQRWLSNDTMATKNHVLKSLRKIDLTNSTLDYRTNVLVGCLNTLNAAGGSATFFLDRQDAKQRKVLSGNLCTQQAGKTLGKLITLAISAVEACNWVDEYPVTALPATTPPRRLTEKHKAALVAGRHRK